MAEHPDTEALRQRLQTLANQTFPARAKRGGYPVHLNHCFLRIVYDNLFDAPWRTVLTQKRAAYRQLSHAQLLAAIELGERITDDKQACAELNERSLELRGKR